MLRCEWPGIRRVHLIESSDADQVLKLSRSSSTRHPPSTKNILRSVRDGNRVGKTESDVSTSLLQGRNRSLLQMRISVSLTTDKLRRKGRMNILRLVRIFGMGLYGVPNPKSYITGIKVTLSAGWHDLKVTPSDRRDGGRLDGRRQH